MRKIFISAGHSNVPGRDRGASSGTYIEGELAVGLRDKVANELKKMGVTPVMDNNRNILAESITFFKNLVSKDAIVLDIHWNSGPATATGTEVLIPSENTSMERNLAKSLADVISKTLNIPLRGEHKGLKGVKTEADSHHGRLGWMRLTGENVLIETCFISNPTEMKKYLDNADVLAKNIADVLYEYANDSVSSPVVPTATITKEYHTVVSGDTLGKISKKYNTTIDSIKKLNSLNSDIIQIGQKLRVR